MNDTLHIYALPGADDVRFTALTRATDTSDSEADLPPLAAWLGVDTLEMDRIELFPIDDLGEMPLTEYATMVFPPDKMPDGPTKARLNAVEGMVLLVPAAALDGVPAPGPQIEHVADIALAMPDHRADLPKADLSRAAEADTMDEDEDDEAYRRRKARRKIIGLIVVVGMLAFVIWRRVLA